MSYLGLYVYELFHNKKNSFDFTSQKKTNEY
jgi:predicted glycosyltransferase involved in capsule biosynthesis